MDTTKDMDAKLPRNRMGPGEAESPVSESFARWNRRISAERMRDPMRAMFAERDKIRNEVSGIYASVRGMGGM